MFFSILSAFFFIIQVTSTEDIKSEILSEIAVISIDETIFTLRELVISWFNKKPYSARDYLVTLFTTYVEKAFGYFSNASETISERSLACEEFHLVENTLKIFDVS